MKEGYLRIINIIRQIVRAKFIYEDVATFPYEQSKEYPYLFNTEEVLLDNGIHKTKKLGKYQMFFL